MVFLLQVPRLFSMYIYTVRCHLGPVEKALRFNIGITSLQCESLTNPPASPRILSHEPQMVCSCWCGPVVLQYVHGQLLDQIGKKTPINDEGFIWIDHHLTSKHKSLISGCFRATFSPSRLCRYPIGIPVPGNKRTSPLPHCPITSGSSTEPPGYLGRSESPSATESTAPCASPLG